MELDGLRIGMFVLNALDRDPRVWREAEALASDGAEVEIFMLRRSGQSPRSQIAERVTVARVAAPAPLSRKPWLAARQYWPIYRAAGHQRRDVYHCHDGAALPLGVALARRDHARLVYDAHEYFPDPVPANLPESFVDGLRRRFMPNYLWEMALIRRADLRVTVTYEMARLLAQRYRLAIRPAVVSNTAPYWEPNEASRARLRDELGVEANVPLVVFLGSARASEYAFEGDKDRGIETLIDALAFVPTARLAIIGAAGPDYENAVLERARRSGTTPRVHFLGLRSYADYLSLASGGDVGAYLTGARKQSTNRTSSLPNRLFDLIMARLPVLVGAGTEAARVVAEYGVGRVLDTLDPRVVASSIEAIIDQLESRTSALRPKLDEAARELCWENESQRLIAAYTSLAAPDARNRA